LEYLTHDAGQLEMEAVDRISNRTGIKYLSGIVSYVTKRLREGDRKTPEHMFLLGVVNNDSFINGRLQGEFYSDVPPALQLWKSQGKNICLFSKGDLGSLPFPFRYATDGPLDQYIDKYFGIETGDKTDPDSYKRIADALIKDPRMILSLNDLPKELDAADKAGYQCIMVIRPSNEAVAAHKYRSVQSFKEVSI
jgi:enolase-phosphatase E1